MADALSTAALRACWVGSEWPSAPINVGMWGVEEDANLGVAENAMGVFADLYVGAGKLAATDQVPGLAVPSVKSDARPVIEELIVRACFHAV